MGEKNNLIFFGNERIATGVSTDTPTLRALLEAGYTISAIVVSDDVAISRKTRRLEVAEIAEKYNIPLHKPDKLSDINDQLLGYSADVGVLVAYGKLIPQSIIDLFPKGIINIHPSALPKHRGSIPIESCILSGEKETAVSLMKLTKEMDAGPIYAQKQVSLIGNETKQELAERILNEGSKLLIDTLPSILSGSIDPSPQDDSQSTYDKRIQKEDGNIDWNKSAEQIEREIRAFFGWPKSYILLKDLEVVITKAHVIEQNSAAGRISIQNKELVVFCGTKAISIDRLKPAGKGEMDIESFLNGYSSLFK